MQDAITGYLPGFATPRIVCDVPRAGKHLVHQAVAYDRVTGVSTWQKNYRTSADSSSDADTAAEQYFYYDPVPSLPIEGQTYWREFLPEAATDPTFVA